MMRRLIWAAVLALAALIAGLMISTPTPPAPGKLPRPAPAEQQMAR